MYAKIKSKCYYAPNYWRKEKKSELYTRVWKGALKKFENFCLIESLSRMCIKDIIVTQQSLLFSTFKTFLQNFSTWHKYKQELK